jgi:hypothetical protein
VNRLRAAINAYFKSTGGRHYIGSITNKKGIFQAFIAHNHKGACHAIRTPWGREDLSLGLKTIESFFKRFT